MSYQRRDNRNIREEQESEFKEEVIHINRVAKVVKGGRKFNFTALVAVGDGLSRVGLGYGRAGEVVDAIKKGVDEAKRNMINVYKAGSTIPYEVRSVFCSSTLLLRPAAKGHGIIAGGSARPILALAGYEDVTAKFIGSTNPVNCARATFEALKMIESPERIKKLRGGEKVDKHGKFTSEKQKSAAAEIIEEFTAEEEAAKRAAEDRLSKPKADDAAAQTTAPAGAAADAEIAAPAEETEEDKV
ncbi:30S ribosomal protein S5 [bacterium]|nr:30S ribosomal protein S5 [bacterium]